MQIKRGRTGGYPGHWTGRFVWDDKFAPVGAPVYRMFRATFDLPDKELEDAVLRITAADMFILYINGRYVRRGPCRSLTPQWMYYDEPDIKEYLVPGKNVIAAEVFWHGVSNAFTANQRPGFFFECEALFRDGTAFTAVSDESVRTLGCEGWNPETPRVNTFQGQLVADYDAAKDPVGWKEKDFDDSAWESCWVIHVYNNWSNFPRASVWEYLEPRLTPALDEIAVPPDAVTQAGRTIPPQDKFAAGGDVAERIAESAYFPDADAACRMEFVSDDKGDPYIVLDFTEPRNAVPYIEVDAPEGVRIEFAFTNTPQDGRPKGLDGSGRFAATYRTRGGLQRWHPWNVTTAFRYLMVIFRTGGRAVTLKDVGIVSHEYPLEQTGYFECSDPVLTKLWQTCVRTNYLHLQDMYIMDPSRERTFYMLCGEIEQSHMNYYIAYGDVAATKTHFRLMTHFQLIDGKFPLLMLPAERRGFAREVGPITSPTHSTIPGYSVFYGMAVRRRQLHFPDPEFYGEQYTTMLLLAKYLERNTDENSLLYNVSPINWLDWPTFTKWRDNGHFGALLGYNAAYVGFAGAMADIEAELGHEEESRRWKKKKKAIKKSVEKLFWDEEMGLFRDFYNAEQRFDAYSELMNCYAIIYGIGTKAQHKRIIGVLKSKPEYVTKVSPLYYHYILEAFYKAGAAGYITEECSERYKAIVEAADFPTLPEFWPENAAASATGASVHGGGGGVANSFTAHIAGITPQEDGFRTISFAPKPGRLGFARAAVPTPLGLAKIDWKKARAGLNVSLEIPKGATGMFAAPEGYKTPKRTEYAAGKHSFVCRKAEK